MAETPPGSPPPKPPTNVPPRPDAAAAPQEAGRERRRLPTPSLDDSVKTIEARDAHIVHEVLANFFEKMPEGWAGNDPRAAALLRIISTKIFRYMPGRAKQMTERLQLLHRQFLEKQKRYDELIASGKSQTDFTNETWNKDVAQPRVSAHHEAQKPFLVLSYLTGHGIVFTPEEDKRLTPKEIKNAPDIYPSLGSDFYIDMHEVRKHAEDFLAQLERCQVPGAEKEEILKGNLFADIFADSNYHFAKRMRESAFERLFVDELKPDLDSLRTEEHKTKSEIARAAFRSELLFRLKDELRIDPRQTRLEIEMGPGAALSDGSIELIVKDMRLSEIAFLPESRVKEIPAGEEGWQQFRGALIRALRLHLPPSVPHVSWTAFAPDFKLLVEGAEAEYAIDRRDFGISDIASPHEALERLKGIMPAFPKDQEPDYRNITFRKVRDEGPIRAFLNGRLAPKDVEDVALLYFRSVSSDIRSELYAGTKHLMQRFNIPGETWHTYLRGKGKAAKRYLEKERPDYVEAEFPDGSIVLQDTAVKIVAGEDTKRDLLNERARLRASRLREASNEILGGLLESVDEALIGMPPTNESDQHARDLELFVKFISVRSKQRVWDIVNEVARAEALLQAREWTPHDLHEWAVREAKKTGKRGKKAGDSPEQVLLLEAAATPPEKMPPAILEGIQRLRIERLQKNYIDRLNRIDRALNGLFAAEDGTTKGWSASGGDGIRKMREDAQEFMSALRRGKLEELPEGGNFVKTFCTSYLGISFSKEHLSEAGLRRAILKVEESLKEREAPPLRKEILLSAEEVNGLDAIIERLDAEAPELDTIIDQMKVLTHAQDLGVWDSHPRFKTFEEYLTIVERNTVLHNKQVGVIASELDSLSAVLSPRQKDGFLMPWALVKASGIAAAHRQKATEIYEQLLRMQGRALKRPLIVRESKLTTAFEGLSSDEERIREKKYLVSRAILELWAIIKDPVSGEKNPVNPEVFSFVEEKIDLLSAALSARKENESLLDGAIAVIRELEKEE